MPHYLDTIHISSSHLSLSLSFVVFDEIDEIIIDGIAD
jgi:hypothetical protein